MTIFGTCCLAYYVILCMTVKRWDSTFSRSWIVAGIFFLCVGRMNIQRAVPVLCVMFVFFLVVELRIIWGMFDEGKEQFSYLVVLGAKVRGTQITDSLFYRLKKAEQYLKSHPDTVVIVSGGQGKGEEITEALAMERYLCSRGIEAERIIKEERSHTTKENLEFSSVFIKDMHMPTGIVTNNFHMYRAICYARRLGYKEPHALTAGCKPVLFPNYMVREFFAVLKMWFM